MKPEPVKTLSEVEKLWRSQRAAKAREMNNRLYDLETKDRKTRDQKRG